MLQNLRSDYVRQHSQMSGGFVCSNILEITPKFQNTSTNRMKDTNDFSVNFIMDISLAVENILQKLDSFN